MNTRRIKRVGVRTLIIAAALVAFAFTAGLVYAAEEATITSPNDQSIHEVGKEVTLKAKADFTRPEGASVIPLKYNYIYFRVTKDNQTVFYQQSEGYLFNNLERSVKFIPNEEGAYQIEVCRDNTYVDDEHVDLAEENFVAEDSRTLTVQKDISKNNVQVAIEGVTDKVYTGEPLTQEPVVTVDGKTLSPETDYDLSYSANTNAGTGTAIMTIIGKGFYKNNVTANFSILPADISTAAIGGLVDKTYNGKAQTQEPIVTWNGRELVAGTDYDVSYQNNTNAGAATVIATGLNNFKGSASKKFTIKKESIWNVGDPALKNMTYTGSPITQNLDLWYGRTLVQGEDYTATYKNNVEPGTATVTITGINNFKDSKVRTFSILEPTPSSKTVVTSPKADTEFSVGSKITVKAKAGVFVNTYIGGLPVEPDRNYIYIKVTRGGQRVLYETLPYTSASQEVETTFTPTAEGKYVIQMCRQNWIIVDGKTQFISYDDFHPADSINVYVGMAGPGSKKDISKATITGVADKVYTGNSIIQTPIVKYGTKTLANGTDYYITYASATYSGGMNTIDVGTVRMTVHGKGGYTGTISQTFNITQKKITADMVILTPSSFIYNGSLQKPEVSVMHGARRLADTVEYELVNDGGTDVGEYEVSVTAKERKNYTGSVTKKYVIGAWSASVAAKLTDKIAEVKAVQSQYLADDQKALRAAVKEAEKLFANPNTTTEQMKQALKNLNTLLTEADTNLAKYNAAVKAAKALPSAAATQKAILAQKTDKDPSGSSFRILRLRSTKQSKTSSTLTWQKVSGATSYVIYANKCGKSNKIKKIATVKKNTYTHKKLKKGTYYKYVVVAVKSTVIGNRTAAISKMIHVSTKGSKYGNFKKVSVTKAVLTKAKKLKKGKSLKLGAKAVKASSKAKIHVKLRYQTSNKKVATVSSKGVVKGVGKGSCYVFVYAQNGVYKKIPVTVK